MLGRKERGEAGKAKVGASMWSSERDSRGRKEMEILGSCQMAHCALESRFPSF